MTYPLIGNLINYLATAVFQLSLAFKYGTNESASQIVYLIAISSLVSSVFIATCQSEFMPIIKKGEYFQKSTLLNMVKWTSMGILVNIVWIICFSYFIGNLFSEKNVNLVILIAIYGALHLITAVGVLFNLVSGQKFVPYILPALPSICAALSVFSSNEIESIFIGMNIGFIIAFVIIIFTLRKIRFYGDFKNKSIPKSKNSIRRKLTFFQYCVLSISSLLQKSALNSGSPSSLAIFNYADRITNVQQQLFAGTILTSSMSDWVNIKEEHNQLQLKPIQESYSMLLRVIGIITTLSVAFAHFLIIIFLEHGNFTRQSSLAVEQIFYLLQIVTILSIVSSFWSNTYYVKGRSAIASKFGIINAIAIAVWSIFIPYAKSPYGMSIGILSISAVLFCLRIRFTLRNTSTTEKRFWKFVAQSILALIATLICEMLIVWILNSIWGSILALTFGLIMLRKIILFDKKFRMQSQNRI